MDDNTKTLDDYLYWGSTSSEYHSKKNENNNDSKNSTILISNLPSCCLESDIFNLFDGITRQTIKTIVLAKDGNICIGYAHVNFDSHASAAKALNIASARGGTMSLICKGGACAVTVSLRWGLSALTIDPSDFQLYFGEINSELDESLVKRLLEDLIASLIGLPTVFSCQISDSFNRITNSEDEIIRGIYFIKRLGSVFLKIDQKKAREVVRRYRDAVLDPTFEIDARLGSKDKLIFVMAEIDTVETRGISSTSICVSGVLEGCVEDDFRSLFERFGDVLSVKIALTMNLAFISFSEYINALAAISHLKAIRPKLKGRPISLSWAKSRQALSQSQEGHQIRHSETLRDKKESQVWLKALEPVKGVVTSDRPNYPEDSYTPDERHRWLKAFAISLESDSDEDAVGSV